MEVQLPSFLTSALDGGQWSTSRQSRFNPSKETRYLFNRRLCGPQHQAGRFGEQTNLLPLSGFEPRIVQPAALTLYWWSYLGYLQLEIGTTPLHDVEISHIDFQRDTAHVDSATCGLMHSTIYSEQTGLEDLLSHRLMEDFNTEF